MTRIPVRREHRSEADRRAELRALLRYDPRETEPPASLPAPGPQPLRLFAIVLAVVEAGLVVAAVLAASLAQVSSTAVAIPAHERTIGALTELDVLLPLMSQELQAQIDSGADRLAIPGTEWLVASVAPADAVDAAGTLDPPRLREAVLAGAATAIYERGAGALGEGASGDWLLARLSSVLNARQHATARTTSAAALVATLGIGALLAIAARPRGWLVLGLATLAGGAVAAALSFAGAAATLALATTAEGTLRFEELAILQVVLAVPIRNGLIVSALGLALTVMALCLRVRRSS